MDHSSIPPIHLNLPETRKHSKLGIASFILGFLAATFPAMEFFSSLIPPREMNEEGAFIIVLFFMYGICSFSWILAGLGLGFGALVQKRAKKIFGILGLLLCIGEIFWSVKYFLQLFTF